MVAAPEMIEPPLRRPPPQVAGTVEHRRLPDVIPNGQAVRYEALGGLRGEAEIARRDTQATNADLASHAGRHRLAPLIEHVDVCVRDRAADADRLAAGLDAAARRVDRGLRRAVAVPDRAGPLEKTIGEVARQGLPAADRANVAAAAPTGLDKHPPGGGRRLHHGRAAFGECGVKGTAVGRHGARQEFDQGTNGKG